MPAFSKTACHLLPSLATIRAIMYSCTSGKYLRNFAGDPSRRRQSHFGPSSRLQCLHSENKVAMACGSLFEYEASKSSESGSKNDAPYNLVSIEDLGSSISIAGQ
ncbi:hypothetical protein EV356DRAFT_495994 [Viridothelium virens]|uniref:Uncharacterized protein n=1 Tax=Viridothelium virens TaxID=1048519 RepID=A0A6A6HQP6_VIRVR|nr:hypothetical protein EV356DRAFT_495994 [Viridothelium virens]